MFCKKCGKELNEVDVFCTNCGQPTDSMSVTQNGVVPQGGSSADVKSSIDFVTNFKMCMLDKYVSIKERGSRQEYWYFILASFACLLVLTCSFILLGDIFGDSRGVDRGAKYALGIFEIVMLLPMTSVTIRRLQDIGKSGTNMFWGLIPLVGTAYLIILLCQKSQEGDNEYGSMPDYSKYRM